MTRYDSYHFSIYLLIVFHSPVADHFPEVNHCRYISQNYEKVKLYRTWRRRITEVYDKLSSALIKCASALEQKVEEIREALRNIKEVTASCHQVIYFLIVNNYIQ